jgi:serine/threonine protein phosphatase PrpC
MAIVHENGEPTDMISLTSYCAALTVEKKRENGEDCETHSINKDAAYFGVFDGCGGAGSQPCPKFHGKTEAYIASRVVGEAFQNWFESSDPVAGWNVRTLKELVLNNLRECDELVGEKSMLVGGIKKKFPTTAAAGICYPGKKTIEVDLYWAGDSRVYLLIPQGLAQLTEDDLGGIDAMENLTDDGVLTNMISLSRDFEIHTGHVSMDRPGFIFSATDGCFGYLSTPMEFEYLLLETMLNSDCVSTDNSGVSDAWMTRLAEKIRLGWQEKLIEEIGKIAGDDYTISGYAIGFSNFEEMKKAFIGRANNLYSQYISGLNGKSYDEKLAMWKQYKENYHRNICRA